MSRYEDQVRANYPISATLLMLFGSPVVLDPARNGSEAGSSTGPRTHTRSELARHSAAFLEDRCDLWTIGDVT